MIEQKLLKVICINPKSSTKLIKGATYKATSLYTSTSDNVRKLYLKDVGYYDYKNFSLEDGSSLTEIKDFSTSYERLDSEKTFIGQFIRCKWSYGKSLKGGELYYVENEKREVKRSYGTNTYVDLKFKLRGIKNFVGCHSFEEVPLVEQRKIKLKNLKGEKIKTGDQTRKFLLYTEKERTSILFETLSRVLIDLHKIEFNEKIDIVKLILSKGKNYCMIEEDVKIFLENSISDTIKHFNIK